MSYLFFPFDIPDLSDMADAAPAGDRGGFRGGFGDRGRQVFQSLDNSQHIKVLSIVNNCS